mgnify:CR=1 FL=1
MSAWGYVFCPLSAGVVLWWTRGKENGSLGSVLGVIRVDYWDPWHWPWCTRKEMIRQPWRVIGVPGSQITSMVLGWGLPLAVCTSARFGNALGRRHGGSQFRLPLSGLHACEVVTLCGLCRFWQML